MKSTVSEELSKLKSVFTCWTWSVYVAEHAETAQVKGWSNGIVEAVENTPQDGITRNRITDRCAVVVQLIVI